MFHTFLIRVCSSYILLALVFGTLMHAHYDSGSVMLPRESEPFLPVTDEHRAAWNLVLEDCLPLNTRTALSARCMTSLGEYFPNEPVWSYKYAYEYDNLFGWRPLYYNELSQRRHYSPADFLNPDIPFWRHIFDDQIEQRQELFLRVVNDAACQELASPEKLGIHDDLAEQCAARELYQYAAYLSACVDATQRLTQLQEIVTEPPNPVDRALNRFELSFHLLDENVSDEALRAAAKRYMEKSYLHASWVAAHCHQHGLVLRPGVTIPARTLPSGHTFDSYTSTDEKFSWGTHHSVMLRRTHGFIMKIAMKSGDDWAIRSGDLGSTMVGVLGEDLMQRFPLLIHRILGDRAFGGGYGLDFTAEERAHHRAKAYLLLVEAAGEEFARREYHPETLAQQIQYIKAGGVLKAPLTHAEIQAKHRERILQREADKVFQDDPSK